MARRQPAKAIRTSTPDDPPPWWRCSSWPTDSTWQHHLVRDAFTREPAVIGNGPRRGWWYWCDELRQPQNSSGLTETDDYQEHRDKRCAGLFARVFTYAEPPAESAQTPMEPLWRSHPAHCSCGQRLLLIRPDRTQCERCRLGLPTTAVWSYEPGGLTHHDSAWWDRARAEAVEEVPGDGLPDPVVFVPETARPASETQPAEQPRMTPEEAADWAWQFLAPLYDR